jgi:DNA processing protein
MSVDMRAYWVWLQAGLGIQGRTDGVVSAFASPKEMFEAGQHEWRLTGAVTNRQIQRLENYSPEQADSIVRLCEKNGWQIITPDCEDYPPFLLKLNNFPAVLYTWGSLSCLKNKISVAVVGARSASRYSIDVAGRLSASLASAGAVVVSGGALGIDSAAHTGALYGRGKTVAVLGCGLAANYLPGNRALRAQIAENGAVVSEYPPETQPLGQNFPIRNRLISGLSYGTVVIEAGERSGSLITAGYALEQGRDVFAVPGDIINSSYTGTNKLIRDGAKPVFSAEDILEEYAFRYPGSLDLDVLEGSLSDVPAKPGGFGSSKDLTARRPELQAHNKSPSTDRSATPHKKAVRAKARRPLPESIGGNSNLVYSLILFEPTHIDDIVRTSKLNPTQVITALTELEIFGFIELTSGKRYVLI